MFITITVKTHESSADIRIDSEQKVGMGLQVLREAGKLAQGEPPAYFRSKQGEKLVSAYKTFQDEAVYDGDILTAIN